MVTNNGGESRNKGTKNNGDGKERGTSYRNGEKKDYKSYNKGPRDDDRRNVRNNNDNKGPRDGKKDYRDNKNGGNDRGQRNSFKNNDFRQNNKFGGNKPYKKNFGDRNYGNPYDKDSDEDSRPQRRPSANKDNKIKEQQPDKIEIINRIEKEKKAMQKKQAERKNNKPVRQQTRPKRTNNIDWTRAYENDSYDDDDLDMYL